MLETLSANEIVSSIYRKEITPEEVVSYYLDRINTFNPILNAIVSLKKEDMILEEARSLTQTETNQDMLLFGLPLAIKDLFDVKGLPTTYGLPFYKSNIAKKNSILVDRLIKHGALIIGKTNIPELAIGSHTSNKLFGVTANAYDQSKTAGGSSGGAATAVAASLVPFADGSDMMGSCRNPAAYANLYGYRPTPGLIPEDRNMKIDEKFPLLSTPGCIARTPSDLALLLDAISGIHSSDPYSFDPPSSFRKSHISDDEFSNIKVGWLGDLNKQYTFEDGILDMCENFLKKLDEDFLSVNQDRSIINTSDLWHSWTTLRAKNNYLYLKEANLQEHLDLGFGAQWELEKSKEIKTEDLIVAFSQRDECKKTADVLFSKYDFLAMPSAQVFPFEKEKDYPIKISDKKMDSYHRWMEVVTFSSLLGLPSISIPVGFSKFGLPMGMQIIGKKGNDINVVAFAKKYEEIFNHSTNRPNGF